jgi:NADPH:quinone reductase-like Zn-dependent oxidoreductase
MCRALALNRVRPVVDRTFGFDDARAALEHLKAGSHFGKIAIAF